MSLWKYSETGRRMRIPRKHAVSSCYFIALNHLRVVFTYCKKRFVWLSVLYVACQPVTEGYKRTGNGWCTRGERATERLIYVCFSVLMLCDWLILTWHLPTLERAIKPLSEELIESFIQVAHIWGFNEGWSNENNIVWTGVFFPTIYHVMKGNFDRIEDETHFLIDCPNVSSIIEMFFSKLDPKIPFLRPQSHETLSNLMNSTDYFINIQLSFIFIILLCIERQTCLRDN